MTKLLVSVRSAVEALAALEGGADLIDVKEPLRGPLGAADAKTITGVTRAVAGRAPVSAALGELLELPAGSLGDSLAGVAYAKLGLAGCQRVADWPRRWAKALERFPSHVAPVAVIYADDDLASSPTGGEILHQARQLGCRAVLVDTFDKSHGGLLNHWKLADVADFIDDVRSAGLLAVLAGSLSLATIPRLLPMQPDYVAVRGAACGGDRTSELIAAKVRELSLLLEMPISRSQRCRYADR